MQPNVQTPLAYFVKISFCAFPWWVGEGSSIFRLSFSSKKPAFVYLDSIACPTFIVGKKIHENSLHFTYRKLFSTGGFLWLHKERLYSLMYM